MAHPIISMLAQEILHGRKLVVLAGAGLSMALPTEMEGGADVATRVVTEVRTDTPDFPELDDPGQVYDEMFRRSAQAGIGRFVEIVQHVGFANYPVNEGHKAIIRLFLEGGIEQRRRLDVF